MRCCYPEIARLMTRPETRPVTSFELDVIVALSGRTRGVFATDPTASRLNRKHRHMVEPPTFHYARDPNVSDDQDRW